MKTSDDLESALRRLRELCDAREKRTSGVVIDLREERKKRQARAGFHGDPRLPPRTGPGGSRPDSKE